ncbi:MAG: PDZ domain-containing protein [Rhodanobacter sp.]
MRHMTLIGTLFLAAAIASPAHAGWYTTFHNTHDSLVWHNSDHRALELHSDNSDGVEVTKIAPADLWGLRKGDVILAVDGHPVMHVDELFKQLQTSKPAPVTIRLRRGHAEQVLTIAGSDYTNLVNPHP